MGGFISNFLTVFPRDLGDFFECYALLPDPKWITTNGHAVANDYICNRNCLRSTESHGFRLQYGTSRTRNATVVAQRVSTLPVSAVPLVLP